MKAGITGAQFTVRVAFVLIWYSEIFREMYLIFLTNTKICSSSKWLNVTFKCSPAFISRKSVWKYLSFFNASFLTKILINYVSADICYSKYAYCSHVRMTRRKRLYIILWHHKFCISLQEIMAAWATLTNNHAKLYTYSILVIFCSCISID